MVIVEEVLVDFIPLVPVNDTGFETSAEGLENFFVLLWLRTAAAQQRSATARKSQVAVAIALTVCE